MQGRPSTLIIVRDARPLVSLRSLQSLDLSGNPLDTASVALLRTLIDGGVEVVLQEHSTEFDLPDTAGTEPADFLWFEWSQDGSRSKGTLTVQPTTYTVAGMHIPSADYFVDGLLVPCEVEDCSGSPPSPVRADSWGRI